MSSNGHDTSVPLYRVLGLLDRVKKSGTGYEARCPGSRHKHEDKHPSLSLGLGNDGRVLLDCKAGCETTEILAAMGLGWGDLFEKSRNGNPVHRYRLLNNFGQVVAEHVREDVPGDKVIRWESRGKAGLNGLRTEDLPLYRGTDVAARPGSPVILCEGEKATEALAELGLLAVGTVTGAASTPSDVVLGVLAGREVWLWPDNDEPGREHMMRIEQRLRPPPKWIEWKDAPPKGDAADYVAGGGTAEGVAALLKETAASPVVSGPLIWTGPQLAAMAFDAPRWAIPDLLPAGLAILAGRPKLGKSWLALGWSLDIPRPALALRKMKVIQGETLYLALEDGPRRMQERMALMLGDVPAPLGFHVVTEWPRTNEGGLDLLDQWLTVHDRARLVVVDTFKRIRPVEKSSQRLYDLDYDAIAPLAELARRHNVAIVLVFHTRKMQSDDPLEMVSGTLGVSGAADAVLVLRRERGQADASLFVTGRDVEEQDLALRWEKDDELGWSLLGNADQFRRSKERQLVLDAIETMPGMSPSEIADAVDRSRGSVRKLLFSMVRDGGIRTREGKYYSAGNSSNSGNSQAVPWKPLTSGGLATTGNSGNSGNNQLNLSSKLAQNPVTDHLPTAVTAVTGPGSTSPPPVTHVTTVTTVPVDTTVTPVRAVVSPGDASGPICRRCGRPQDTHGTDDPIKCQFLEMT